MPFPQPNTVFALMILSAVGLTAGCYVPAEGDGTPSECTTDTLGATFSLSASEVDAYGGSLSYSDCSAECEYQVMQNYPEDTPNYCEIESDDGDSGQTFYCEWEAIVSCP